MVDTEILNHLEPPSYILRTPIFMAQLNNASNGLLSVIFIVSVLIEMKQ